MSHCVCLTTSELTLEANVYLNFLLAVLFSMCPWHASLLSVSLCLLMLFTFDLACLCLLPPSINLAAATPHRYYGNLLTTVLFYNKNSNPDFD